MQYSPAGRLHLMNTDEWYYLNDNVRHGPVPHAEVIDLIRVGSLQREDLMWKEGMTEWAPASSCLHKHWPDRGRETSAATYVPIPPPAPTRLYGEVHKNKGVALEKCYSPFLIALISIFGLGTLTVGYSYYFGLFAVAIGFSISNFIIARDNKFGTAPWDLIIMILAAVSLVPLVGWFTQMTALGFAIAALVKKTQA